MRVEGIEVAVPDGTVAAWRIGDAPPGAPEILAIHGITATSRAWLAVARALGDRAALIAPDLRGRGASGRVGPPFGLDHHMRDIVALLDHLGRERTVVAGHSLGAYVACRLATRHPDRVARLVLVDGGLPIPAQPPDADPALLLGPVLARLRMVFADRPSYRAWWREHPAFADGAVDSELLDAYADYDLTGEAPQLRSSVNPDLVAPDSDDVRRADDAARLECAAVLLHAPRGLDNRPPPLQPASVAQAWVDGAPDRRRAIEVPDCNHYTIAMAPAGAEAVAAELLGDAPAA